MTTADYPAMPSLEVDEEAARRECAGWSCAEPGQLPRCQLCTHSPTYWRRSPEIAERAQAETERVKNGERQ